MPGKPSPRPSTALRVFRGCGVAPLGAFVVLHVLSYSRVLLGRRRFGDADALELTALEVLAELVLVVLPLAFHAAFGLFLVARPELGRAGAKADKLPLDVVQRASSPLVLWFVLDHFFRFRWPVLKGDVLASDAHALLVRELSSTSSGLPLVAALSLAGVAAVAFHLGYGAYRYEWERLPWLRAESRRRWLALALALLVLLPGSFAVLELATGKRPPFL